MATTSVSVSEGGGEGVTPASMLSAGQLTQLREEARRTAGSLVDPSRMRRIHQWWSVDLREWAGVVVDHPVGDLGRLSWREWVLLDLAHELEPSPPPPPALTAQRAVQEAARARQATLWAARVAATKEEWAALRAGLSFEVFVAHNYTSRRHTETFVQGGDHVILLEALSVGRLHREARQPLCRTRSRAKDLCAFSDSEDPWERWPTCKRCLRIAYKLAGREPSDLLMTPGERVGLVSPEPNTRSRACRDDARDQEEGT